MVSSSSSSSREKNKKASAEAAEARVLHEKLQLLRSITNSHAKKDSTIIRDASKYIEELKHKVQLLNHDISTTTTTGKTSSSSSTTSYHNSSSSSPVEVTVEGVEEGIQVNLYSERSSQGLLVFILKVFEELNLNVLEATISCTGTFHLQALGGVDHLLQDKENGEAAGVDAQMVKQAILHAIQNYWSSCENNNDDDQD